MPCPQLERGIRPTGAIAERLALSPPCLGSAPDSSGSRNQRFLHKEHTVPLPLQTVWDSTQEIPPAPSVRRTSGSRRLDVVERLGRVGWYDQVSTWCTSLASVVQCCVQCTISLSNLSIVVIAKDLTNNRRYVYSEIIMNTHRIHRVAKLTGLTKDVIRV